MCFFYTVDSDSIQSQLRHHLFSAEKEGSHSGGCLGAVVEYNWLCQGRYFIVTSYEGKSERARLVQPQVCGWLLQSTWGTKLWNMSLFNLEMWRRICATPEPSCHFYEVIRAGSACHLYFDLEYKRDKHRLLCSSLFLLKSYFTYLIIWNRQNSINEDELIDRFIAQLSEFLMLGIH